MEAYRTRVLAERTELSERFEKLQEFINSSDTFRTLPLAERELLVNQSHVMVEYLNILHARVERWNEA